MNAGLLALLACPRDGAPLQLDGSRLRCDNGHDYAVIDGIPFLIRDDMPHPHWAGQLAVDIARGGAVPMEWTQPLPNADAIDKYVQLAVGATNGNLYKLAMRGLPRYPIPAFPLRAASGQRLLDVGCNWGRWSVAASRAGYDVIGIDPQPEAIFAARRVCAQLGVPASFVIGDARFLPFHAGTFDAAFSFSVLQHLDDAAVELSAIEMRRVLCAGGTALVQMASAVGLRSLVQMARRGFRPAEKFQVRYRSPNALRRTYERRIGPTRLSPESYLSLNARVEDLDMLTPAGRAVVRASAALVTLASIVPPLRWVADSVWLQASKAGGHLG